LPQLFFFSLHGFCSWFIEVMITHTLKMPNNFYFPLPYSSNKLFSEMWSGFQDAILSSLYLKKYIFSEF
jgi:hypothetical protein